MCHRVNEPLNTADDRLYVMHQLYVIANNYLIPVACSRSCPFNPDTPLLSSYASHWDSHCPLVNHDAISRHRGPRLNAQPARSSDPTWCLREPRVHRGDIYVPNGKEDSQYFKVKLSDLDSVGGQDDRSSFPTVTAKSCFGVPPNDVFVAQTRWRVLPNKRKFHIEIDKNHVEACKRMELGFEIFFRIVNFPRRSNNKRLLPTRALTKSCLTWSDLKWNCFPYYSRIPL